jgi:hypothetical protein
MEIYSAAEDLTTIRRNEVSSISELAEVNDPVKRKGQHFLVIIKCSCPSQAETEAPHHLLPPVFWPTKPSVPLQAALVCDLHRHVRARIAPVRLAGRSTERAWGPQPICRGVLGFYSAARSFCRDVSSFCVAVQRLCSGVLSFPSAVSGFCLPASRQISAALSRTRHV